MAWAIKYCLKSLAAATCIFNLFVEIVVGIIIVLISCRLCINKPHFYERAFGKKKSQTMHILETETVLIKAV